MDFKERWELEADVITVDDDWKDTFRCGPILAHSPTWREFDWKLKMCKTSVTLEQQ